MGVLITWSACAELPEPAELGVCGNRIIEAGEACDGFGAASGAACGAPGTAVACRLICSASAQCPTGSLCSNEGQCRRSARTFQSVGTLGTAYALEGATGAAVRLGDVDGDGLSDLVSLTGPNLAVLEVRFGAKDQPFSVARQLSVAQPNSPPALLSRGPGVPGDILLSTVFGLLTVRVDSNRNLRPVVGAFSSSAVGALVVLPHRPGSPFDHLMVVEPVSSISARLHFPLENSGSVLVEPFTDPLQPTEVLAMAAAPLDRRPGASPALVTWLPGTDAVKLLGVDCLDGQGCAPNGQSVDLSAGFGASSAPVITDLNFDGAPDLLYGTVDFDRGQFSAAVGYGNGSGDLCAQPWSAGTCATGRPIGIVPLAGGLPDCSNSAPDGLKILGAGDLNGDGRYDVVTGNDVQIATGVGFERRACLGGAGLGTVHSAEVADFDADGLDDVAVRGSAGVLLLFGSRSGFLGRTRLFGNLGETLDLAAGDFDDDGAADLAILGASGEVWAWRGDRAGGALTVESVGRTTAATGRGLAVGHFAGPVGITLSPVYPMADALSDVVVLGTSELGAGSIDLYLGTGRGQLLPVGGEDDLRVGVGSGELLIGRFGPSDEQPDLLFASFGSPLWARFGVAGGGFQRARDVVGFEPWYGLLDQYDVDGDGVEELIWGSAEVDARAGRLVDSGGALNFQASLLFDPGEVLDIVGVQHLRAFGGPEIDRASLVIRLDNEVGASSALQITVDGGPPKELALFERSIDLGTLPSLIRGVLDPTEPERVLVGDGANAYAVGVESNTPVLEEWYRRDLGVTPAPGTVRSGLFSGTLGAEMMLGDVDGDGFPDLVWVNRSTGQIELLRQATIEAPLAEGDR